MRGKFLSYCPTAKARYTGRDRTRPDRAEPTIQARRRAILITSEHKPPTSKRAAKRRDPEPGSEAARHGGTANRNKYGREFYRGIGKLGGRTTRERYGTHHYSELGHAGGERTKREYGSEHFARLGRASGAQRQGALDVPMLSERYSVADRLEGRTTDALWPSLLAAFAHVPDVRSHVGRRYPVAALLALATAAIVSGARSVDAIVQWGRLQPPEIQRALGFSGGRLPTVNTIHNLFKRLDVAVFEAAVSEWVARALERMDG